jgi:hypothetical protein
VARRVDFFFALLFGFGLSASSSLGIGVETPVGRICSGALACCPNAVVAANAPHKNQTNARPWNIKREITDNSRALATRRDF